MGEFLSYSMISGMCMLLMYVAYRMFLSRDNQHGYNRCVLLSIYIVSFSILPVISLSDRLMSVLNNHYIEIANIGIVNSEIMSAAAPAWGPVLVWLFLGGILCVTIKTVITWLRIIKVIMSGEKIRQEDCIIVIVDNDRLAPFSWIKYMVISRRDYENRSSAITIHELKHISCRHWIDLLLAQIVCIINWFNPAAWLMREELMLVHEYQADKAVIESGYDAQQYQLILIKKAVGTRFPSLANSLNHSKLKKRIKMMYKEKSGAGRKIKALALVPMLALALGVAAVPEVRAIVSTIGSSGLTVNSDVDNGGMVFAVTNLNNNGNVTRVTIKGKGLGDNMIVSGGTFTTMGKTYKANGMEFNLTDGEGTITVTFPFMSEFENSSMTLMVNGEEIPFNLENFFNHSRR